MKKQPADIYRYLLNPKYQAYIFTLNLIDPNVPERAYIDILTAYGQHVYYNILPPIRYVGTK